MGHASTRIAPVAALEDIVNKKGETPEFIRCDNRTRADRQRAARLVPLLGHGNELHRTGLAVGEPFRGVLRLTSARRVAVDRAVRHPARGAGIDLGLEARIQHLPAAQQSWLAFPARVRYGLEEAEPSGPTPIRGGPTSGVRSRRSQHFGRQHRRSERLTLIALLVDWSEPER
jgi:hypothetical protein